METFKFIFEISIIGVSIVAAAIFVKQLYLYYKDFFHSSNTIGLEESNCEDTVSRVKYSTASGAYKRCFDFIINTNAVVRHEYNNTISTYAIGSFYVMKDVCYFDRYDICWGLSAQEKEDLYDTCFNLMELQIYMGIPC